MNRRPMFPPDPNRPPPPPAYESTPTKPQTIHVTVAIPELKELCALLNKAADTIAALTEASTAPPGLAEVIARCRDALKNAPGHSNTAVRVDDLQVILDAAEAGMKAKAELAEERREFRELQWELLQRTGGGAMPSGYRGARNDALEEAAAIADRIDTTDKPGWQVAEEIEIAIRALKEKP